MQEQWEKVKKKKLQEIKEREDYKNKQEIINQSTKKKTNTQRKKKDRRVVKIAGNYTKKNE